MSMSELEKIQTDGYNVVDGLFFGHVDGRNPIKLIEDRARR
jgi:hypothetical protein